MKQKSKSPTHLEVIKENLPFVGQLLAAVFAAQMAAGGSISPKQPQKLVYNVSPRNQVLYRTPLRPTIIQLRDSSQELDD